MGADSKAVDLFINAMINGYIRVNDLDTAVKQLSQSIMNIPNRVISIGVQQYTVPSSGGGTKNVNVLGGGNNASTQEYNFGGKRVGVTSFGGNDDWINIGGMQRYSLQEQGAMSLGQYQATFGGSAQEYASMQGRLYNQMMTGQIPFSPGVGGTGTTTSEYNFGGSTVTVHGQRAAGGPTDAGKTYLVGENGPELMTMSGAGNVTNANSTASILSGGRDTLSLIEDHLYNALAELRIHTNYFETYESDFGEMIACLKEVETEINSVASAARSTASSSYGYSAGGGNSSRSSGGYGRSSANSNSAVADYNSVYMGPGISFTNGTGAIGYGVYNITPSVLGTQRNPGMGNAGFATGGQILPGEDQKVEFFKRNKERVLIVDDGKVSDQRSGGGSSGSGKSERPIQITNHFHGGDIGDARSRQSMADDFRRAVQQATRR